MPHTDLEKRRAYSRQYQKEGRSRLAMARWAEREHRLHNRASPSSLDCCWAAGHFEGEGTVSLTRGGRVMHVRPLVSLSSTDVEAVEFFVKRWPGTYRTFIPKSMTGNVRRAHVWTLNSGEKIQGFLLDILPHVRTARVREKIGIVLDDIQDRGLYRQQPESKARSELRRETIRRLNAKGPPLPPPRG